MASIMTNPIYPIDPLQTGNFPHSSRSAKLHLCEVKCYKAALGDCT